MPRGHSGESCHDAMKTIMRNDARPYSYSELKTLLHQKGSWKDSTIRRMVMSAVVNLPPAREEWTSSPFLLVRQDGRFEIYDRNTHGRIVE